MLQRPRATGALMITLILGAALAAQEHQHAGAAEKVGTVSFETSCSAAAQPQFNRAVALLHSFEFGRAIECVRRGARERIRRARWRSGASR